MGILSKIIPANKFLDATPKIGGGECQPKTRRPTARCGICQPPYGRHFWMDAYGEWRCTQCSPPAVFAMVRDQVLVPADDGGGPQRCVESADVPLGPDGEFVAGDAFPAYSRGRWRYYEDRGGRHWERISFR